MLQLDNIMISCLYDNLKATGWRVFVTRERAKQQSGQECSFFICTNSHCRGEVVVHVQQKYP